MIRLTISKHVCPPCVCLALTSLTFTSSALAASAGRQDPTHSQPSAASAELPAPSATPRFEHEGFHIGFGLGTGTLVGDQVDEPGLLTQFKIGHGFSHALRVYYYALNHWYTQSYYGYTDDFTDERELDSATRIVAINGIGLDYYFLPNVALRLALGLGGDLIYAESKDVDNSESVLGFAYALGFTFDFFQGSHHFTVDPVINIVTLDVRKFVSEEDRSTDVTEWKANPVLGVVLGYAYH